MTSFNPQELLNDLKDLQRRLSLVQQERAGLVQQLAAAKQALDAEQDDQ
jgi:hypothetical protein